MLHVEKLNKKQEPFEARKDSVMCVKDIALPKLEMSFTHEYHIFSEIVECWIS